MTADLGKYTDLHLFAKEFPERYYQMGMAEQLLMGAAAGMAHEGAQPFVTTYAVFAARRAYDFIHQAIAEDNLDVKIVCALPGLTTGYGPSHQAAEDLALLRAMPNLTVIDPCDALEIEQMVPAIADHRGPVYARLLRGNVPVVLDEYDYQFELGKAKLLRDGAEVLIISSGIMTMRALETAKALAADRVGRGRAACADHQAARHRHDPARSAAARAASSWSRRTIPVIGGLGEAVATALLTSGVTPPFRQIGLARRVPRRGRAADAARPLRHFDRVSMSTPSKAGCG